MQSLPARAEHPLSKGRLALRLRPLSSWCLGLRCHQSCSRQSHSRRRLRDQPWNRAQMQRGLQRLHLKS